MDILRITKENLSQYVNTKLEFDGHIEFDENLGLVVFASLKATGYIWARAGTGIEAGEGIKAGLIIWRKPQQVSAR